MTDVSVPPTPFDDEVVTRKILREELAKYATHEQLAEQLRSMEEKLTADLSGQLRSMEEKLTANLSGQLRSMEESLIATMTALLEPSSDHGQRLTQLEARTTVLTHRVDELEAPRTVRRKSTAQTPAQARKPQVTATAAVEPG